MHEVVVGLDGCVASSRALEWAARTVGPHGVIHAVTAVSPATELLVDAALADSVEYRRRLQIEIDTEWTEAVRDHVHQLTTAAVEATAAEALLAIARDQTADAIVVGGHVPAAFTPVTIGSTIRHVLRDLPCPLIVVPQQWQRDRGGRDPIIVGVGHGEATDEAVRWAARLAESHGLGLGLVRATGDRAFFSVDGLLDLVAYYIDPSQRDVWSQEDLVALAHFAQSVTETEITIGVSAVPGLPAVTLVEAGLSSSLLVIGQRRSEITGARHSTQTLRYALAHARCPVAVVPVRPES